MEMLYTVSEMCDRLDAEHKKNFPSVDYIKAKPVKFLVEKWDGYTHTRFSHCTWQRMIPFSRGYLDALSGMTPGQIRVKYKNIPIEFIK